MFNNLKNRKVFIIMIISILSIFGFYLYLLYKKRTTSQRNLQGINKETSNTNIASSNINKVSASNTKVSEENVIRTNVRSYIIKEDILEVYEDGKIIVKYPISELKSSIYQHAMHITGTFENYKNALNSENNKHMFLLVEREYNIPNDYNMKQKFCLIRKRINFCPADNECPGQEC